MKIKKQKIELRKVRKLQNIPVLKMCLVNARTVFIQQFNSSETTETKTKIKKMLCGTRSRNESTISSIKIKHNSHGSFRFFFCKVRSQLQMRAKFKKLIASTTTHSHTFLSPFPPTSSGTFPSDQVCVWVDRQPCVCVCVCARNKALRQILIEETSPSQQHQTHHHHHHHYIIASSNKTATATKQHNTITNPANIVLNHAEKGSWLGAQVKCG